MAAHSSTWEDVRVANTSEDALYSMYRHGQPGAPLFDKNTLTEFLCLSNIEFEDANLTDKQKCARVPYYCTLEINIEYPDGYKNSNWKKLQEELRRLFWQYDKQKNTPAELDELIHDATNFDLNIFVLKYASISDALIRENDMTVKQRVRCFLDGLSDELRDEAFEFCVEQDRTLFANDIGSKEPILDELKEFILEKARLAQRMFVYDRDRTIMAHSPTYLSTKTPLTSYAPLNPTIRSSATSVELQTLQIL